MHVLLVRVRVMRTLMTKFVAPEDLSKFMTPTRHLVGWWTDNEAERDFLHVTLSPNYSPSLSPLDWPPCFKNAWSFHTRKGRVCQLGEE